MRNRFAYAANQFYKIHTKFDRTRSITATPRRAKLNQMRNRLVINYNRFAYAAIVEWFTG